MKFICESLPNLKTSTIVILTRNGASNDVVPGLSTIMMGSMRRGTSTYSETEIARMTDGKGSELFTTIEKDFSAIGIRTVPEETLETIPLLVDILANPLLPESVIESEKKNLTERIMEFRQNPLNNLIIFENDETVFGKEHPLSTPVTGIPETIETIKKRDIIETLESSFFRDPVALILGNFTIEETETLETEILSKWENSDIMETTASDPFPRSQTPRWNLKTLEEKHAKNAYLALNVRTDPEFQSFINSRVAYAILGGSFGSRMLKMRDETGLSYIAMATSHLSGNTGVVMCVMDVDSNRVQEGLQTVFEILYSLSRDGVGETEYNTSLEFLFGQLDLSFDHPRDLIRLMVNGHLYNAPKTLDAYYSSFDDLTQEDFNSWCRNIITPETLSLSVAGKFQQEQVKKTWNEIQMKRDNL